MKLYETLSYSRITFPVIITPTDSRIGILEDPISHFEIMGRWVLCEFKVSAGPRTRAKVADDSLGV